jgi:integrase
VRDVAWDRTRVVASLKEDVWRHLTQTARTDEDLALEASRLLQMPAGDVLALAHLHFVLSQEVGSLLEQMPALIRRLSTTTVLEREQSAERVRGSIRWSETYSARAASGLPHLYVTDPTRRAFDTAENQLLVFALDAIADLGRMTGWEQSTSAGVGELVRDRVTQATRWRRSRALADIPVRPPADTAIARVRASRRRRIYSSVLATVDAYRELISHLDRQAVKSAVESHALVTRDDAVLLELLTAFGAMRALVELGWQGGESSLIRGGAIFSGTKEGRSLRLFYQQVPGPLRMRSRYAEILRSHGFSYVGALRPDLVVEVSGPDGADRLVLLEVKGVERPVAHSARAALLDLLAYRQAFAASLGRQPGVYGIGVAWGSDLPPAAGGEVLLCSPDTLPEALARALAAA